MDGDGCSRECSEEEGWKCIKYPSICTNLCGNGIRNRNKGEDCDDGNDVDGDGCTRDCSVEDGWDCVNMRKSISTCVSTCGDGLIVGAEECDDGNLVQDDGCDMFCSVQSGWICQANGDGVS